MATKRPSLGRGLEALLGSVTPAPAPTPATAVDAHGTSSAPAPAPVTAALRDEELARIPVDLLQRGRYQPRLDMRPESLQELADSIQTWLRGQMPIWRRDHPGVESMSVAVMGCVVNGPGESKHANIGISLPGSGEAPVAPVFVDGVRTVTLKGDHIAKEFQAIVDDYVRRKYVRATTPA